MFIFKIWTLSKIKTKAKLLTMLVNFRGVWILSFKMWMCLDFTLWSFKYKLTCKDEVEEHANLFILDWSLLVKKKGGRGRSKLLTYLYTFFLGKHIYILSFKLLT